MENETKTTIAKTHIEVMVHCPYCDNYQDILDDVRYDLQEDFRLKDCEIEIDCNECQQLFIVTEVEF